MYSQTPDLSGNEPCPNCGWTLIEDAENRFECSNPECHGVAFRVDGIIMGAFDPRRGSGVSGTAQRAVNLSSGAV